MEEQLKSILKKHRSFSSLNASERHQLAEWCADEQEFQEMKSLFQQVDVWSEKKDDESNTKQRLDQLFAIQYAGKQSTDGRSSVSSKQRFLSWNIWGSIGAVAAALVLTWYFYPTSPNVPLAKNDVKKEPPVEKQIQNLQATEQKTEHQFEVLSEKNEQNQEMAVNQEGRTPIELGKVESDNMAMDQNVRSGYESASAVANANTSTLISTGATSYTWGSTSLGEVQASSIQFKSKSKDIGYGRKEKDAFTAFSLKSMPEMLDVLVASY